MKKIKFYQKKVNLNKKMNNILKIQDGEENVEEQDYEEFEY